MTEAEAKTKWCPFARVAGQMGGEAEGTSFNRWTSGAAGGAADPAACIGSACMAWRKTGAKFKDGRTGQLSDRDMTGHGKWIDVGYCGLAGAPQ